MYSDQSSPLIINSILWNNGTEIYYSGGEVLVYYSDLEGGWTGTGTNNIDTLPHFQDPLNYDFHLQDVSPCIGAGIDSIEIAGIWYYAPSYDFDGNPRPNPDTTKPDMGAYESPLGIPVSVENSLFQIPKDYSLSQNYPNPFNPNTTIEFALPTPGFVTLSIFNILGEKVATLVSENLAAGSYKYDWDATELTSGIYFYRIQAGNFIETRKMILLK